MTGSPGPAARASFFFPRVRLGAALDRRGRVVHDVVQALRMVRRGIPPELVSARAPLQVEEILGEDGRVRAGGAPLTPTANPLRAPPTSSRPRVGVSACLLGEPVRYDGSHRGQAWLVRIRDRRVALVPVCPEVELGLGVPREPIALVGTARGVALRGRITGRGLTRAMDGLARRCVAALQRSGLHGFVLKSRSPSCGLAAPVVGGGRAPGRFAAALRRALPWLPVVEEGDLALPAARRRFLRQVKAFFRLDRDLRDGAAGLARFHAREELFLRAHAPELVPRLEGCLRPPRAAAYRRLLGRALRRRPTRRKHVLALRRGLALVRGRAAPGAMREAAALLRAYGAGQAGRRRAAAVLRRLAVRTGFRDLAQQTYFTAFGGDGEV